MRKSRVLCRMIGAVLACAVLAGCSVGGTMSLDEMLRAPQLTGEYSAVQTALNEYLGESAQLKYPANGDFLSPFLFGDWDGDDVQDAAVLYVSSTSVNVQLAILQKDVSGNWKVCGTAEGLSDSVDSVSFAAMRAPGADQILVGYTITSDEYLAVYSYTDGKLETVLQQPYNQYLIEDFTGRGTEDLVLLSSDENGQTQVQMLTDGPDGFTSMQVVGLSSEQFSGYASLAAGKGAFGGNYLILDGWTGASGSYLASSILRYDATTGQMDPASLAGTDDVYNDSLRYASCLISRDLDNDGIVEIPAQSVEEAGTLNLTANKRFSFVRWMDFTGWHPEKSFGIVDEEYGFYLELPAEWEGNLLMTDGAEEGEIQLSNLSGDEIYMTLRVTDDDVSYDSWQRLGMVASMQILAKMGPDIKTPTAYMLSKAIYIL
ncbi:MAG: hypothetical protein LKJ90_02315 [Faecalibacterium sp.]|nr:hypothetical protein [Faecalibacterium sp.]